MNFSVTFRFLGFVPFLWTDLAQISIDSIDSIWISSSSSSIKIGSDCWSAVRGGFSYFASNESYSAVFIFSFRLTSSNRDTDQFIAAIYLNIAGKILIEFYIANWLACQTISILNFRKFVSLPQNELRKFSFLLLKYFFRIANSIFRFREYQFSVFAFSFYSLTLRILFVDILDEFSIKFWLVTLSMSSYQKRSNQEASS